MTNKKTPKHPPGLEKNLSAEYVPIPPNFAGSGKSFIGDNVLLPDDRVISKASIDFYRTKGGERSDGK